MYLQLSWTDPDTGAAFPAAALVIDDAQCHLAANHAQLAIAIYADATAAQPASQRGSVYRDAQVILTPGEIDELRVDFQQQLYAILQRRAAFASGTLVA